MPGLNDPPSTLFASPNSKCSKKKIRLLTADSKKNFTRIYGVSFNDGLKNFSKANLLPRNAYIGTTANKNIQGFSSPFALGIPEKGVIQGL